MNAVQRMIEAGIHGVEFVAVNTDAQQLAMSDATVKLALGREQTRGLGAGADPELGRKRRRGRDRPPAPGAARLRHGLRGGRRGRRHRHRRRARHRAAARELGALTVAIVTMPFGFEGKRRPRPPSSASSALQGEVDTLIVVPNDRLLQVLDRGISMVDAFRVADDVLRQGVQGICDLITRPGLINLDFADVRTVMQSPATRSWASAWRPARPRPRGRAARARLAAASAARSAARAASCSRSWGRPTSALVEVTEAAEAVREAAPARRNIIFGASVDPTLGDQFWVTVIATGFERREGVASADDEPERSRDRSPLRELEVDDDLDVPAFLRD